MTIAGAILAGGLGRRLGGGDKPLRLLGGRPILDHAIARFQPQVAALALNANGDPARFAQYGLPVIADVVPENPGPLAGVQAGLLWARRAVSGSTHLVTVSGDTPFLPADLVTRLATSGQHSSHIVVAESGGRRHPVIALWPLDLADRIDAALKAGTRRVWDFVESRPFVTAHFEADRGDPFFNINTAGDLDAAERMIHTAP